ncbi:MAG: 50S ribosomal protein L17 [Planctomycetes bacterium]|nr:50S ribosomal protein L17 [Planctomycetota bacterium]MBI3847022.1 50S ribosomal protein L17 [Planctomycetota bacterium]
MRHRRAGRKLGRTTSHRDALRRNIVVSLLRHERITTTLAKAKEFRGAAERLITLARDTQPGTRLHDYRRAISFLQDKIIAKKLFTDIAPRFAGRPGGYTRVVRLAKNRLGDNGPQAIWELTVQGAKEEAQAVAAAAEATPKEAADEKKSAKAGSGKKTKAVAAKA